ncbi:MAG: helicase, partial [Deltaproteobacteria bacterium]|nr:helicase [Candidatus Tharpella sp.]
MNELPGSVFSEPYDPPSAKESCGQESDKYLHPDVVNYMRQEIVAAGGNEVFFRGRCEAAKVVQAKVLARGNQSMTPALTGQLKAGEVVIHNHPSSILTPSDADLRVASILGSEDIAFLIVDNPVTRVYAVVEPVEQVVVESLPPDLIEKYFFLDGALAKVLPSFEFRSEQADLGRAVVEAFNQKSFLLAEAGTGVGKSLAYLIPAALWAVRHKQRVVISTNTINLQEQLLNKDLPLLTEHLGLPVKAALIKGRSNYLCRRRVKELAEELLLDAQSLDDELKALVAWAQSTGDGSRADFPSLPSAAAWEMVSSEADACLASRCLEFGHCFFYKARREAARAQLLVVNHHLLMADLQFPADFGVLPRYEALVLDEVHHLEEAATGYLGENVSQIGLLMLLNRLAHQRRPELGLLRRLRRRLGQGPPGSREGSSGAQNKVRNDFFATLVAQVEGEAEPAVLMLLQDLGDHFEAWREILAKDFVSDDEVIEGSFKLRVTDKERSSQSWKLTLGDKVEGFIEEAQTVTKALLALARNVEKGLQEKLLPEDFFTACLGELKAAIGRLQSQVDFVGRFFLKMNGRSEVIAWIEAVAGR